MEGVFVLLALGATLFFLVAPVLGVIAFIRAGELKREMAQLRAALATRPAAPSRAARSPCGCRLPTPSGTPIPPPG